MEASVEITPKLISVGVCAAAVTAEAAIIRAVAAHVRVARITRVLLWSVNCFRRPDYRCVQSGGPAGRGAIPSGRQCSHLRNAQRGSLALAPGRERQWHGGVIE